LFDIDLIVAYAMGGETRLTNKALRMGGMSSRWVRNLLNKAVSTAGVRYLEVGVWHGSTFYSALCGNKPDYALAIDNFTQFGGSTDRFLENMSDIGTPFELVNSDCFKVELSGVNKKFNVYFYDGGHEYEDQRNALTYYQSVLDDEFLLIVDDYNWPEVRRGTQDGIKLCGMTVVAERELFSRGNEDTSSWWNGIYLAVLRKGVMENSVCDKGGKPKICVYGIAKNEEQFVDRFMDSVKDADLVVIADTGSTDNTVAKLRARGAVVHSITVDPWRFDVARNMAIDLVPPEYTCLFSMDLDETIDTPDWKQRLQAVWVNGATRGRYYYAWSPEKRFVYDKIHDRSYRWVSPCHEVLQSDKPEVGVFVEIETVHRPDNTKSRGSYLGLLKMAVEERPDDDRVLHYYGRELYYRKDYVAALPVLQKHIEKPTAWVAERAESCRMAAECFLAIGDKDKAEAMYKRGCEVSPNTREPHIEYAKYLQGAGRHYECIDAAANAGLVRTRANTYLEDAYAWGAGVYDLISVSMFYVNNFVSALRYGKKALAANPNDPRIVNNMEFFKSRLDVQSGCADPLVKTYFHADALMDISDWSVLMSYRWMKDANGGWMLVPVAEKLDYMELTEEGMLSRDGIIFCNTGTVDSLFEVLRNSPHKYSLITHNDDRSITEDMYKKKPRCIKRWYSVNVACDTGLVTPLPIGLQAPGHENGSSYSDVRRLVAVRNEPKSERKLALLNVNSNHQRPSRAAIVAMLKDKPFVTYISGEHGAAIPFEQALRATKAHKFTISPEGAGMDCHRTWEAMYLGTIPVVKRTPFYDTFDLPILQVDDYSEVTEEFLNEAYGRMSKKTYNMDQLTIGYWKDRIRREHEEMLAEAAVPRNNTVRLAYWDSPFSDPVREKLQRQGVKSLEDIDVFATVPVRRNRLKRSSKLEFGLSRDLPFFTDIVDAAMPDECDSNHLIGYWNADGMWTQAGYDYLKNTDADILVLRIIPIATGTTLEQLKAGDCKQTYFGHVGWDGFLFRPDAWRVIKKRISSNFVIGEWKYDQMLMEVIMASGMTYEVLRCLYHPEHGGLWKPDSDGGKHNAEVYGYMQGGFKQDNRIWTLPETRL